MKLDRANQIIERLRGTCNSVENELKGDEDLDNIIDETQDKLFQLINDEIFECITCGWWYELCELSEKSIEGHHNLICVDCSEDE